MGTTCGALVGVAVSPCRWSLGRSVRRAMASISLTAQFLGPSSGFYHTWSTACHKRAPPPPRTAGPARPDSRRPCGARGAPRRPWRCPPRHPHLGGNVSGQHPSSLRACSCHPGNCGTAGFCKPGAALSTAAHLARLGAPDAQAPSGSRCTRTRARLVDRSIDAQAPGSMSDAGSVSLATARTRRYRSEPGQRIHAHTRCARPRVRPAPSRTHTRRPGYQSSGYSPVSL